MLFIYRSNDLLIRPNESFICSNDSCIRSNDLLIRPNESYNCLNDSFICSYDLQIRANEEIFFIWPLYAAVKTVFQYNYIYILQHQNINMATLPR